MVGEQLLYNYGEDDKNFKKLNNWAYTTPEAYHTTQYADTESDSESDSS